MRTTESLVAAVEALELGAPWSAPVVAAESAIAADRAAAESAVFPVELTPVPADAIAAYTWHTSRLVANGYGERLAATHRRAVSGYPALAQLLRSVDALEDVGAAAASMSYPTDPLELAATAAARAAAEARARYQVAIAHQLADVQGHELAAAARALLAALSLATRLAAARARHQAAARTEIERAAAERRAAAQAVGEQAAQRVLEAEQAALLAGEASAQAHLEHRRVRAAALVARLRSSRLAELRTTGKLYDVEQLIAVAADMSMEQLARHEAALNAQGQDR